MALRAVSGGGVPAGTVPVGGPGVTGGGSTDKAVVRWLGTSGTEIQNSTAILDDTGNLTLASVNVTGATIPANGVYLAAANTLGFSAGSTSCITLTTSQLITSSTLNCFATSTTGWRLDRSPSTAIQPTVIPNRTSPLSGVGGVAGVPAMIVAALTQMAWLGAGGIEFIKGTDPVTAAGAGLAKLYWVAGTTGTSGKLIAYAGTSTTPVTIVDNVGSGF